MALKITRLSRLTGLGLPGVVKVLPLLVPVEDGEAQHASGDGLGFLQQLVQMHHGIICKTGET